MSKTKHDLWPLFHEELGIPYDEYMLDLWIADHGFMVAGVYEIPSNVIEEWMDKHARPASKKLKEVPPRKLEPLCYLCQKPTSDEMFCFGCKKHVCDKCDQTGVIGDHSVHEHQIDED
jgi:hypothetical protein